MLCVMVALTHLTVPKLCVLFKLNKVVIKLHLVEKGAMGLPHLIVLGCLEHIVPHGELGLLDGIDVLLVLGGVSRLASLLMKTLR